MGILCFSLVLGTLRSSADGRAWALLRGRTRWLDQFKDCFAPLVTHWLTHGDSWTPFPPPLTDAQVAAIYRHLVASTN